MSRPNLNLVQSLREQASELAAAVVERHWHAEGDLAVRYGARGREHCLEDARHHLRYPTEAVAAESDVLFADYLDWASRVLQSRNVALDELVSNIEHLRATLHDRLDAGQFAAVSRILDAGWIQLQRTAGSLGSLLDPKQHPLARRYLDALLDGDRSLAVRLIMDAVEEGMPIRDIYLQICHADDPANHAVRGKAKS